jgi:hypothetical protein
MVGKPACLSDETSLRFLLCLLLTNFRRKEPTPSCYSTVVLTRLTTSIVGDEVEKTRRDVLGR